MFQPEACTSNTYRFMEVSSTYLPWAIQPPIRTIALAYCLAYYLMWSSTAYSASLLRVTTYTFDTLLDIQPSPYPLVLSDTCEVEYLTSFYLTDTWPNSSRDLEIWSISFTFLTCVQIFTYRLAVPYLSYAAIQYNTIQYKTDSQYSTSILYY